MTTVVVVLSLAGYLVGELNQPDREVARDSWRSMPDGRAAAGQGGRNLGQCNAGGPVGTQTR